MARRQTIVQLSDEILGMLDAKASREGVSRSHLIRSAIENYLDDDREAAVDRAIVDGYRRFPQGGESDADQWGDVGEFVTSRFVESMNALNEEEQEAGFEPW